MQESSLKKLFGDTADLIFLDTGEEIINVDAEVSDGGIEGERSEHERGHDAPKGITRKTHRDTDKVV